MVVVERKDYKRAGELGDWGWELKTGVRPPGTDERTTLYVFNDNARDSCTTRLGGGNGAVRPYNMYGDATRGKEKAKSTGVCTGNMPGHLPGGGGYQLLDGPTKKQIDTDLRRLMHLVETGRFQHVFIAVDADCPGMIGVGLFAVAPVVREYIYQGICAMCGPAAKDWLGRTVGADGRVWRTAEELRGWGGGAGLMSAESAEALQVALQRRQTVATALAATEAARESSAAAVQAKLQMGQAAAAAATATDIRLPYEWKEGKAKLRDSNALGGDPEKMGKAQLQGACKMFPGGSGSQGGALQGTVGHLRQKLHALRAAFMASRLTAVEVDVREAQSAASQSAAEVGGAEAGGSNRASGAGGPAAAGGMDGGVGVEMPVPTSEEAVELTASQQAQAKRRESEMLLAAMLKGADGDVLRQPCTTPLADGIPLNARIAVITKYTALLRDLQWAKQVANQTEATEADLERYEGAWVAAIRVFAPTILRDVGGGGQKGAERVKSLLRKWSTGDYLAAYYTPVRSRAGQRQRSASSAASTIQQVWRRVTRLGQKGEIMRAMRAVEAAPLAGATEEVREELQRVNPPAPTPVTDPRVAEIERRVVEIKAGAEYEVDYAIFKKSVRSMPLSRATWMQPAHIRSIAESEDGCIFLHWMCGEIMNARVPKAVMPLLFDSKIIGLTKQSGHQMSITKLAAEAEAAVEGAARDVGGLPTVAEGEEEQESVPGAGSACEHEDEEAGQGAAAVETPVVPGSSFLRPITIGDVFSRMAERATVQQERERMARGLLVAAGQTGVAVKGGMTMGVMVQMAMLELDNKKVSMSADMYNMFNELDRVAMMEDLLDSEQLVGEDFSALAPYVYMSYFEAGACLWFRQLGADSKETWVKITSDTGVLQGRPMSCFLAALALVRPLVAARKALDAYNGVVREMEATGVEITAAERKAHRDLAARHGDVTAYLDDTDFIGRLEAVSAAFEVFQAECLKRNWRVVPKKSVITGKYFETPVHPLYDTAQQLVRKQEGEDAAAAQAAAEEQVAAATGGNVAGGARSAGGEGAAEENHRCLVPDAYRRLCKCVP